MKLKIVLAAVLGMIALGSCSRLSLALNWADTLVLYKLSDYYTLSSTEKTQFKKEFQTILTEVRKRDFPVFASHFENLALAVEKDDLSLEKLQEQIRESQKSLREALARFEPLIQRLTEEQAQKSFADFDQEVREQTKEDLDQLSSPSKVRNQLRERYDNIVDETIEYLTDSQKNEFGSTNF